MLKIGVLGAGHLGNIHLKLLQESSLFELVGFFDPNPKISQNISKNLNLKHFENEDSLIQDVDVIDIVTPTPIHFELAKKAILAKKHVFIEKPITHTLDQALELERIAIEQQVKIQVGHIERFNPAFIGALPYIKNPQFIEIHRLALFNPRGTDVSVVLDLMIHDIDTLLYLVKADIKSIEAHGVNVVSQTADICNARIVFENNCVANLTASRISNTNMRKSRYFQEEKYISVDFLNKKCEIIQAKKQEDFKNKITHNKKDDKSGIGIDNDNHLHKTLEIKKPVLNFHNAILEELNSFAIAIQQNKTPKVDITAGKNALKVALEIIKACQKNRENSLSLE